MNSTDWYEKSLDEFMIDGYIQSEVSREDFKKVYSFLCNSGLIDYDVEKEFLYEEYGQHFE